MMQEMKQHKDGKAIGVILTYNCGPMVEGLYRRISQGALDEIILVDNNSADDTIEIAKRLGINYFIHEYTEYGGSIKWGLKKALELGADYIVEIHGDGQYDPVFIPDALKKIKEGYDFLLGSRFTDFKQPLRDKMPLARYLANVGLSFIDRLVLGIPLTEFHSGFRVYSRRLLKTVNLDATSGTHLFSFQIITLARFCNLKITEIPIRCNYADEHTSISIFHSTVYAFQTFKVLFQYILARAGFKIRLFQCDKTAVVQ